MNSSVSNGASNDYSWCRPGLSGLDLDAGEVVGGKYLLLHRIGAGGMGEIWKAKNSATGAEVAVKTLLPTLASSREAVARFRDEARATARLTHRGIVRIFDLLDLEAEAGTLLIVMELLRGHTLAERLAKQGPLSVEETIAVVQPLLSALSHAHGVGVVHRDVKPENIFLALEPDGQICPKLLDFGVSQLREPGESARSEGVIVGTPCYMSPEQERGEVVDARCDVYGVGLLLYECLAGINPFRSPGRVSFGYRRRPLPIGTVSPKLWAVIERALAERREDRFPSAAELALVLSAVTKLPRARALVPARSDVLAGCGAVLAAGMIVGIVAARGGAVASARPEERARGALAVHGDKYVLHGTDSLAAPESGRSPAPPGARKPPLLLRAAGEASSSGPRRLKLLQDPGF